MNQNDNICSSVKPSHQVPQWRQRLPLPLWIHGRGHQIWVVIILFTNFWHRGKYLQKNTTIFQGTRTFCFSPVSLAVEASWGPKDGSTSLFQGVNYCRQSFQLHVHNHLFYRHSLCACLAFLVLVCCLVCRSCPLARWDNCTKSSREKWRIFADGAGAAEASRQSLPTLLQFHILFS